jgi:hypothetical protein
MRKKNNFISDSGLGKGMLICLAVSVCFISGKAQVSASECGQIQPSLINLSERTERDKILSQLFEIGDRCIEELIAQLNGKDLNRNIAAQEVIRYLGNESGLKALETWNKRNRRSYPVRGPVPVPIMQFDYRRIEADILGEQSIDIGVLVKI